MALWGGVVGGWWYSEPPCSPPLNNAISKEFSPSHTVSLPSKETNSTKTPPKMTPYE